MRKNKKIKNSVFILGFLAILSCKAQSPIISIVDYAINDYVDLVDGSYLKDVENKFAPFVGTWKWEIGTSSLELQISKLEMVYSGGFYQDLLIGKYRYVKDGVEKFNSLSFNITANNVWGYSYALFWGNGYDEDNYKQFVITDLEKNLHCYLGVELTTPTEVAWKVWRQDKEEQPDGFTFPTEVILAKL